MRQPVWIINLSHDTSYDNPRLLALLQSQDDFWYYTALPETFVTGKDDCRLLMDTLSREGKNCQETFRNKGYPVNIFQVCVLGSDNVSTLSCFSVIATLIRKVFPLRDMQTGIEISGLLFVPFFVEEDKNRSERYALFLDELLLTARDCNSYTRIILYQDIQQKEIPAYPKLNKTQLSELLFQYLLSMYFMDTDEPSVFGLLANNPSHFYTMGATSIYYDARMHRKELLDFLSGQLFKTLTSDENCSAEDAKQFVGQFIKDHEINAAKITDDVKGTPPALTGILQLKRIIGKPNPHPVKDFVKSSLVPKYFLDYLKFLPARLRNYYQEHVNLLVTGISSCFSKNRMDKQQGVQKLFKHFIEENIKNGHDKYATYAQVIQYYKQFEEHITQLKERVTVTMISEDIIPVPKYLQLYYEESKSENSRDRINQILEKLKEELRTEPTVLSALTRCFFLGTVLAFGLTPLISSISEYILIPLFLLLPFIWTSLVRLRRHFLIIQKQMNRIIAEAIWQSQQVLQKRLVSEAIRYLNGLLAFIRDEIKKTEEERDNLSYREIAPTTPLIPQTKFNQPVIKGVFADTPVFQQNGIFDTLIFIGGDTRKVSGIETKDYLKMLSVLVKEGVGFRFQEVGGRFQV